MLTVNVEAEFAPEILQQAVSHLQKAVAGDPGNARYRRTLGEALLASRRYDTGLEHLLIAYHAGADQRTAYLIAYAYWRLGKNDLAEPFVKAAVDADQVGFARLDILRGRLYYDQGKFGDAANWFTKAQIANPTPVADWNLARALVAHARTLSKDTTNLYRRALQILTGYEPGTDQMDEWNFLLGRSYLALQYPADALRHLEKSRWAEGPEKALLLGVAFLLRGLPESARPWLKTAVVTPAMRARCESYLSEIAGAPPDVLQAMGCPDPKTAAKIFIDREFLATIFGYDAPEVDRIQQQATQWRHEARTISDAAGGWQRPGRLFAGSLRESTGDTAATQLMPEASTQVDDVAQKARGQTTEALDILKPRTFVDIGEQVSEATTDAHRLLDEEDDEDDGMPERFTTTKVPLAGAAPNAPPDDADRRASERTAQGRTLPRPKDGDTEQMKLE
jgi:tetratricopeptide (TPR) repeat protein